MNKAKPPASNLTSHLGFWLRRVSNQVSHSFSKKVEELGITVAEWVLLRELYEASLEVAPSQLAEKTRLSRGAVSKLIERLVVKGFVSRKGVSGDRRYQAVMLTKAGSSLVPKLAKLADKNDDEFFGALTKTEKSSLLNTLKKIVDTNGINEIPVE